MELIKDTPFEVAWLTWKARPNTSCLTVVVKATFSLVESGICPISDEQILPTGDIHNDEDVERSVRYESDLAYIKPRGEVLIAGSCFTTNGEPQTAALAAFKVGQVTKKMGIFGDRHFEGIFGGMTKPEPFVEMPLCWERCFGGRKIKDNPVGQGRDKSPVGGKAVVRLPNIEDPTNLMSSKRQKLAPHGAFPIPRTWPARMKQGGTYDARWQRTRWPWYPEDFQWSFFNAAPEDQQIKGFFRGDEEISLVGLHREHAKVDCRLPGLRARALLREAETGTFKLLSPELDTITIDSDAGKVLCVWRAVTEVTSEALDEYSHLFVVHEPLGDENTLDEYQKQFEALREEEVEEEEAFEAEPIPAEGEIEAAPRALAVTPPPEPKRRSWSPAGGIRGDLSDASFVCRPSSDSSMSLFPNPIPLDSPVLIPEMSDEDWEAIHSTDYEVEDDSMKTVTEPGWIMPVQQLIEFRQFEFEPSQELEPLSGLGATSALLEKLAVPFAPAEFELPGDVEDEQEETTAYQLPNELDDEEEATTAFALPVELEGDADDATAMMSSDEMASALMRDLLPTPELQPRTDTLAPEDAHPLPTLPPLPSFQPPADEPAEAESKPSLDEDGLELPPLDALPPAWAGLAAVDVDVSPRAPACAEGEGSDEPGDEDRAALRRRSEVLDAVAAGTPLAELDVDLDGIDLSGCDLNNADFRESLLPGANFSGACLDGARFDRANLMGADLSNVSAKKATFDDAVLQEIKGQELSLEGCSLQRTLLNDAELEGARFVGCECSGAELAGAHILKSHFDRSRLDGADLTAATLDDATFVESSLVEADLAGVSAQRATLDGCELTNLRAYEGSDFTEASFVRAKLGKGRFMGSTLTRANFSFAELDAADFSQSQLARAKLLGCALKEARFDGANLAAAELGKSDLFQARFEGADLQQTDLRGCNLFRAEFLDADTRGAKLELANLEGTKLA